MTIQRRSRLVQLLCGSLILVAPFSASGQVVINGVTGTLALQGSVDKFYSDTNKLLVKTSDGIDHLLDVTKDTTVHGAQSLASLQPGMAVVVHYTVRGIQASADEVDRIGQDGLKLNEGTVMSVNRASRRIAIRFSDGHVQTLRLTHHATVESAGHVHHGNRVVVYYSDESGQKVVHYFKAVKP